MTKPYRPSCLCQRLGHVRPACTRGLTGWLDADGQRRFDALACELDARHSLDPVPPPPAEKGNYRKGKRCAECSRPISDYARSRCRSCASKRNGAKSRGGPRNEAWARRSLVARKKAR